MGFVAAMKKQWGATQLKTLAREPETFKLREAS